jgi:predicted DNA binding protein
MSGINDASKDVPKRMSAETNIVWNTEYSECEHAVREKIIDKNDIDDLTEKEPGVVFDG